MIFRQLAEALHKTPDELADMTPAQLHIFMVEESELKAQGGLRRVSRNEAIEIAKKRKEESAGRERWHGF